jgi:hypothetical protein
MKLLPANENAPRTARVTFVSADACNKYYSGYPNGMEIRRQGKKYTIFVRKGENVDVLSSVMEGYLECGATRVIKVTGAEDDWGIVGLRKLATGKNQVRQIEAINDTYVDEVSVPGD